MGWFLRSRSDTVPGSNPVQLRTTKRPRPLVLRANVGDCLTITLTNSIPARHVFEPRILPARQYRHNRGVFARSGYGMGQQARRTTARSWVKITPAWQVPLPSARSLPCLRRHRPTLFSRRQEGTFLLYTMGDTSTHGDQLARGLFGALNVQPAGAEWYRSQVTADDLALATYNANKPDQVPTRFPQLPVHPTNCTFTVNGNAIQGAQDAGLAT